MKAWKFGYLFSDNTEEILMLKHSRYVLERGKIRYHNNCRFTKKSNRIKIVFGYPLPSFC